MRVGVFGAAGRMGTEVCRAVAGAEDLELVAAVDPKSAGVALADLCGKEVGTLAISKDASQMSEASAEVVVDFTVASAARANLEWAASHGMHCVIGTTGLGAADIEALGRLVSAGGVNCIIAPNFAIGAVLMEHFAAVAALHMEGAEIIELHHDKKLDAPSGTAIATAAAMASARSERGMEPWGQPQDMPGAAAEPSADDRGAPRSPEATAEPSASQQSWNEILPGARGASSNGGIRIHSVRLPGLVAHQEVILGALGQSLTIRHDSYDRRSFMPGVLLAIREVRFRKGLTIGLDSVLGL